MKKIAAILAVAAIAFPQCAIAATAHKDAENNIVVTQTNLAPQTLIKIYYPGTFTSRSVSPSGACNLLTITKSSSFHYVDFIKVNGVQLNLSIFSQPALSGAPCVSGAPNPAYPWRTEGAYRYVQTNDKVFVLGATSAATITNDIGKFRLGKVDACGRISIKNNEKYPIAGLNFGDGTFSYAVGSSYGPDIPLPSINSSLPICRKGILYVPFVR